MQGFLNEQKVPQLFIESGCNCWSNPKYPYSLGWQPPYTVDGKILGAYIKANFAGKKIGYLSQDDEFGQDVVKGLDMEIPASSAVVSRRPMTRPRCSGPLSNQMAALKAAGAQVVVLATIPAATALAMLPAAVDRLLPPVRGRQRRCRLADGRTAARVLHPEGWRVRRPGVGRGRPAERGHHDGVLRARVGDVERRGCRPRRRSSSSTRPRSTPSQGLDGNTQYGVALAYTFVQALQKAGKNLTRQSLLDAINQRRQELRDAGLRAAVVLELGALRLRGRRGRQAGELGPAGGDADRQLDRRASPSPRSK